MAQRKTKNVSNVDRQLWRACAGAMVDPPALNSLVYYFPQGHLEQSSSSSSSLLMQSHTTYPIMLCHVSSVQFLCDPLTDEVFTKLKLHPIAPRLRQTEFRGVVSGGGDRSSDGGVGGGGGGEVQSYAKVLTPSDANNGGGFSVPRFCADSIFPKLDYNVEPPLQTLVVKDLHGVVWKFRHIYRGTPRRHLLTTGWSRFVNSKKMIAGDSVVFMKNSNGDVSVGIRRVARPSVSVEFAKWREQIGGGKFKVEDVAGGSSLMESEEGSVFGSGKVQAKSVVKAIELAMQGMDFEVVYYPKAPWSDFVVNVEVVEEALKVGWEKGLRIKMSMETEDLSRLTWLQGSIQEVSVPKDLPWFNSPWRMLQINWDAPETTHHPSRVNPWQVEIMGPAPPVLHSTFHTSKKRRLSDTISGEEAEVLFPVLGINNSDTNQSNSLLLRSTSFPIGMQGARHSSFHLYSLSNMISGSIPNSCSDNSLGKNMVLKLGSLSTELSIGSSHSSDLSPSSQSSVQSTAEKNSGKRGDPTTVSVNSFQLFGQIINCEPVVSPSSDVGHATDVVAKKHPDNGGSGITVDLPLTTPLTDKTNSTGMSDW